jgi:hypothetical protein
VALCAQVTATSKARFFHLIVNTARLVLRMASTTLANLSGVSPQSEKMILCTPPTLEANGGDVLTLALQRYDLRRQIDMGDVHN